MAYRNLRFCTLHIGTEKTGTTTLQAFLQLNRRELLARGLFVPSSLSPYDRLANHERLTTYALNSSKLNDDRRTQLGLKSAQDVDRHRRDVLDALEQELANLRPTAGDLTLLLSNEHCHSRLVEVGEVQLLKEFLQGFVDKFRIIVYLRPQHELATSLYDTALRAGYADIDVIPRFAIDRRNWVSPGYFDYAQLLSRWATVFGIGNIQVRIYSRSELYKGSIINDFARMIGCDLQDFQVPADKNRSLDAVCQTVLNFVNRYARAHPEELKSAARGQLIAALERTSRGAGTRPGRACASQFFHSYDHSNDQVKRLFFPDRERLFDPDFSNFPDEEESVPPEEEALVRMFLRLSGISLPQAP